jgi:cation diffusion facilitator family transporter
LSERPRGERIRRVLFGVLFLNLTIVGIKVMLWVWTGALSVAAEAAHSGLDALNNGIALLFARVALQGPDEDHPYGHQKFETLGALVVLSITVFELVKGAAQRLLATEPFPIETPPEAFILLALTAIVGIGIFRYETRVGHELGSELLLADAAHTRADVLGTAAVFAGLLAVRAGYPAADPLVTLCVAGFIAWSGWGIVRRSVPLLVDERAVEAREIHRIADEVGGVFRSHAIRSRGRPGHIYVELTITVSPGLDVAEAHEIADEVERRVARILGARDVVVHVEPEEGGGDGDPGKPEPSPRIPGRGPT